MLLFGEVCKGESLIWSTNQSNHRLTFLRSKRWTGWNLPPGTASWIGRGLYLLTVNTGFTNFLPPHELRKYGALPNNSLYVGSPRGSSVFMHMQGWATMVWHLFSLSLGPQDSGLGIPPKTLGDVQLRSTVHFLVKSCGPAYKGYLRGTSSRCYFSRMELLSTQLAPPGTKYGILTWV